MMKRSSSLSWLSALFVLSACSSVRMQRADEAYDLMQYPKAERLYEKVLAKGDDRGARARLANAYRRHNNWPKALAHYEQLYAQHPLSGDTALQFGEVLMALGEHDEAADLFLRVLQQTPENARALDLFESTQGYSSFYADSGRFFVNRLTIPGVASAFGGIPYKQGLLFAGEKEADARNANPWNERSFLDLYHTTARSEVTWSTAEPLPGTVNGQYHEGPAALSADGRTIYFTRSNYVQRELQKDDGNTSHLKLFRAKLDSSGKWSDLHAFAYNGEAWSTGHPTLSNDGRMLYFASDRPGGMGGSDIWRCKDNGTGWSEPENLGPTVNTPGNELFPTINGNTLHFASTAHINMGGLDIFETQEQNGRWRTPINLNAPINTPKDDFFFVLDSTNKAGFLSSDRNGIDQIYAFTLYEPLFYIEGFVTDEEERFLPNVEVILTDLENGNDDSMLTGPDGKFIFQLKPNADYSIRSSRGDLLTSSMKASTKGLTQSDTLHADLRMKTVRIGESIAINNIYYDYDQWNIRPDAAAELDKLARIFIDNPTMSFELGSHTDSRGGDMYNLVLSDARANSAVNYLIQNGVDQDRIVAKGYGEELLVNECQNGVKCTEEDHQANRRTEFKVTGIGLATVRSQP
ncbi:MAG: OmpA family protein [Flavobacteriales bacterium]|nr:OmpA family protein [Flavobacteriales bacterium]